MKPNLGIVPVGNAGYEDFRRILILQELTANAPSSLWHRVSLVAPPLCWSQRKQGMACCYNVYF